MRDLGAIVKAYDVRGKVPDDWDVDVARAFGAAAAGVLAGEASAMVVGHDMRPTSPSLVAAFCDGVTSRGVDVVLIGLASTDQLYFVSGMLDLPGAMFTASHNPAEYNGIKFCRAGAAPVGRDTGLAKIRELAGEMLPGDGGPQRVGWVHSVQTQAERSLYSQAVAPGRVHRRDMLGEYSEYLHQLVDLSDIRPLTVVVDAGNGMAGHTVPAVLDVPGLTVVPLYFQLDGTFPNHEANPIEAANMVDLQRAVLEHGADIGLAFDGDADRCFVVDEHGEVVSPSALTALIAVRELRREPGSAVVHNLITSRAVPEIIAEHGGVPVRTAVGHSLIKQRMAETDAIFGGEHSAHFYFRHFWRADSGMLAALHTLAALGSGDDDLSSLLAPYQRYAASGEINSRVDDVPGTLRAVETAFGASGRGAVEVDHLDGLTVHHTGSPMWWFNLRPSNTEPLLRLNVEGTDRSTMERIRDEVLAVVNGESGEGLPGPRVPGESEDAHASQGR
ncbi:phosphomannomutase/phosphoglucomutase [Actinobacteria bacterium YIM 96077]|uniref:Phosphomannomutase/phosphoglucomutase n=1 Tax=Phytoactinopolyspora halophila TaxID=1981511 RepID=A0A329R2F3_9ACTN|nr:phosphomannomutase/phosphoglucomutase [Phytoactinopolyspora halophila]AYY12045.1 phosphomannomutase/phosphoglucomutase [Actinobacteria bacterium YIM 96077]RAW18721.1 phosphomannomutase/phosphoglucomutase [Phytoactinopolyspora halophila]